MCRFGMSASPATGADRILVHIISLKNAPDNAKTRRVLLNSGGFLLVSLHLPRGDQADLKRYSGDFNWFQMVPAGRISYISAHVREFFHLRLCELIDMISDYHCGCEDCECDEECCHCELLSAALLRGCSEL